MKVLFAVHGYKPAYQIGGPIHSVSALAENLVRNGHSVRVVTTNSNLTEPLDVPVQQRIDVDGVSIFYFSLARFQRGFIGMIGRLLPRGFVFATGIVRWLKTAERPDLVHIHLPFIYPGLVCARWAEKHGIPYAYSQRGVFHPARMRLKPFRKWLYLRLFELRTIRRAALLVALTEAERDYYRRFTTDVPIAIIPNGTEFPDEAVFLRRSREAEILDPELRGKVMVLYLGRVTHDKGAHKAIAACEELSASITDLALVVAGPDEEGILRSRGLEPGASEGAWLKYVGTASGVKKEQLLARADIFVLPSIGEGFSMAVLEAMAWQTAVIATPGCNFPEMQRNDAGLVVDATVDKLRDALSNLCRDQKLRCRLARNGRRYVGQRYGWDDITGEMVSAYQETIVRYTESPLE